MVFNTMVRHAVWPRDSCMENAEQAKEQLMIGVLKREQTGVVWTCSEKNIYQ